MTRKTFVISILIAVIAGFMFAAIAGASFFFFYYKHSESGQTNPKESPITKVNVTPIISNSVKINLSDIDSVWLRTSYLGFYDENSKCRNLKPSYSGPELAESSCATFLIFNRDGSASKTLEIRNYSSNNQPNDKSEWGGKITSDEYESLLKEISDGKDYIEWTPREAYMSNFTITLNYQGKSIQSFRNITGTGNTPVKNVNTFSELDRKINWEKKIKTQ